MPHAVRCPRCAALARVADDAHGLLVACPTCGSRFIAEPDLPVVSVARPQRNPTMPFVPVVSTTTREEHEPEIDAHAARRPVAGAIGLALLPLGIPLGWLVAPFLGLGKPIFSFAAPVSLAVGLMGLALGLAFCAAWSAGARVRAVAAVVCAGYAIGFVLFAASPEWAVAVRRNLPAPAGPTGLFRAPGKAYSVEVPGNPERLPVGPLNGWDLTAFRVGPRDERRDTFLQLVYEFAHGRSPIDPIGVRKEAVFFAAVRTKLADSTGGEVRADPRFEWQTAAGTVTVGDFAVALPDGARRRVVRVVYDADHRLVYYLAVEGAFLPDDLPEVRDFFRSLTIPAK